jgi:hypothetical protein
LVPATASADIEVRLSEGGTSVLAHFPKVKCKVGKGATAFEAKAHNSNAYALVLSVDKSEWLGLGETYTLLYGDSAVFAAVKAGQVQYSNENGPPGTPPGTVPAGGIKISPNGKRIGVGAYGLADPSFSQGLSLTGGAKCQYPKR